LRTSINQYRIQRMGYLHSLQNLAERGGVDPRYVADGFDAARRVTPDGTKTYSLWDAYVQASLAEEIAQFASVSWVAQLAERLRFDLPHALACHAEGLSDLFQRVAFSVLQPEAHL
jgi:hypothetical protein